MAATKEHGLYSPQSAEEQRAWAADQWRKVARRRQNPYLQRALAAHAAQRAPEPEPERGGGGGGGSAAAERWRKAGLQTSTRLGVVAAAADAAAMGRPRFSAAHPRMPTRPVLPRQRPQPVVCPTCGVLCGVRRCALWCPSVSPHHRAHRRSVTVCGVQTSS
eukprot:COSAG04_NODE_2225_length_4496_cov_1.846941_4_plen_162_part_00